MASEAIIYNHQNPAHASYLSSVATIHADCITHDKTIANFMPPLSHTKILDWWAKVAGETVGEPPQRIIILCIGFWNVRKTSNLHIEAEEEGLGITGAV
jgi:hypothetical protein